MSADPIQEAPAAMPVLEGRELVTGVDPRVTAVAKFRELADKLESGELRGARVEWREGADMVTVELSPDKVHLRKYTLTGLQGL